MEKDNCDKCTAKNKRNLVSVRTTVDMKNLFHFFDLCIRMIGVEFVLTVMIRSGFRTRGGVRQDLFEMVMKTARHS